MPKDLEAKLPEDVEAEKVILSALMTGHSESVEAVERLDSSFFHHVGNAVIFAVVKDLWNANLPVDLPSVVGHLQEKKELLESAGGAGYVSSLVAPEYHVKRLEKYLHRVSDMAGRRAIVCSMERIKNLALEANEVNAPEGSAAELAWMAAKDLADIKALYYPEKFTSPQDAAKALVMDLRTDAPRAALTGIPKLDEDTGGFQPGELVIVTAETGAGKTYFVMQVRAESCRNGRHVLFCSGEMRAKHLAGRELAGRTGISYSKIRNRSVSESEFERLMFSSLDFCKECVLMDSDLSLRNIRAAASKLGKRNTSLIIVDYDELVEVQGDDEWDEQRVLVRSLKALAMEREVPIVMVSQLRKAPSKDEFKQPTLNRLYGSGAKSKHASIVLYIDRPFVRELTGDETAATVWILKNRDGKIGKVTCRFNIKTGRFEQEITHGK